MDAETKAKRHVVCQADEIQPGGSKHVHVAGRDIAIFNVNGEYSAIGDRCPHEGASLCRGAIVGLAEADEPGEARMTRHGEFVRCPWHGWEFDLKTGKSWCDPRRTRVKKFDLAVEDGAKIVEGPYKIDVFDVRQEGSYLVIDL
jgi:nitrite reductase/ring-hydroxylating ferredoxin subunit